MVEELSPAHFVSLFRSVAPYVNLFRGKTFVIAFGGAAIAGPLARTLAYDTNLLDNSLLRRDQIWLVEKDRDQASELIGLSEFSPRKNEALERGYLMGRYGGIPLLNPSLGVQN